MTGSDNGNQFHCVLPTLGGLTESLVQEMLMFVRSAGVFMSSKKMSNNWVDNKKAFASNVICDGLEVVGLR